MIETARLRLRGWAPDDLDALAAINADSEVARYTSGAPLTRAETAERLERIEAHWSEHGFGLWAAELREEGVLVGAIGLAYPTFLPAAMPDVELGWRLGRRWWGRGLATEGAEASIRHAFGPLALDRIISIIDPRNARSRRLAERLGMRPGREVVHPRSETVVIWELSAAEAAERGHRVGATGE